MSSYNNRMMKKMIHWVLAATSATQDSPVGI